MLNAGAFYVPAPAGSDWHRHVVVDGDLVTNMSALGSNGEPVGTEVFVDTVRDAILNPPAQAGRRESAAAAPVTPGKCRVLIMLSEWGYWGEELVGPLGEFDRVGYEVEFCTPNGGRPNAIPGSMDPDFFDPPLQRSVTWPGMAARTRDRRSLDAAGRAPR